MSKIMNVVITGATSGFGVDVASAFVKAGHKVVIGGRRADKGAEVAKQTGATYFQVDVSDAASNKEFFNKAKKALGSFDYVLLNAGVEGAVGAPVEAGTFDEKNFDQVFGINVRGTLLSQREAMPYINPGGKIIYTSSIVSLIPLPDGPIYAASKGALDSLAISYAAQFAKSEDARLKSIQVFTINPALYESPMVMRFCGDDMKKVNAFAADLNPCGRPGKGEELAKTFMLIASDQCPYKSGDSIVCDAGQHWHARDNESKCAAMAAGKPAAAAAK
jgi:NAD(P)-dependent dehydrogenase (short-subunit alcohol dehydrogenase family)